MADSRRYNGYDSRNPYGQSSEQPGQRGSSRVPSSSQPAQRRGSYDDVERYPSGRPKTQRQPSGSTSDARGAGYAGSSRGGYSPSGASHTQSYGNGYDPSVPSYRRGTGEYRQAGGTTYDQGGYTAHAGTSYGMHAGSGQRGGYSDDARHQDSHGRTYRDYEGRELPPASHVASTGRATGGQERAQYPRGSHAAAVSTSLPEPLARLADTARANPALVIAMAIGIVVVVVALAFAACSALGNDGSYVQAVDATQGSATNTLSATPSSSQNSTSGDATTTGTTAATDDASTGTDATTQTADASGQDQSSNQQSAVAQQLTPAWPDDVSTVSDIFTFATTSFDKDATYNNGGVEDPWSPTGYFTTGDAELDQMVKDYCDSNAQDGLDAGDNAYYTYLHISWIDYVETDRNQRPWDLEGDWRITYAKQCFSTMSANCHEFAAAVQYILRYYGYADACAETCLVLRQSGNWGDHSLVFVTSLDGRASIIDTSMSSKGWLLSKDSMTYTLDSGYRADLAASEESADGEATEEQQGDQASA